MKNSYDLTQLEWALSGCHPYFWVSGRSMELNSSLPAVVNKLPVKVPCSVQYALRENGIIADWNEGLKPYEMEWIENRHWVYDVTIPDEWVAAEGKKILNCEGLDYQGHIYLNGKDIAEFKGSFTPHSFDITEHLREENNQLSIIFTDHPRSLGQQGYTSWFTEEKPRYYYCWDWTPRLVQVGIWDKITLDVIEDDACFSARAYTDYDKESDTGTVSVFANLNMVTPGAYVKVKIKDETGAIVATKEVAAAKSFHTTISVDTPLLWQPNGNGEQHMYTAIIKILVDGKCVDKVKKSIGFKQVRWLPCKNAPKTAEPWICEINGVKTFLQGANWVPIRTNFADVTDEEYRERIALYKELGFNILRIWGGAVLEREIFYNLCNEAGILVWQEFPLSSSGHDNWPPEDEDSIHRFSCIARSYIERRQHHVSLLLWCGGNELQRSLDGRKQGCGWPVGYDHPLIAAFRDIVASIDPTRRFLPSSSSGPRFTAEEDGFGKGIHHDVHGPWNHGGDLDSWIEYWKKDDALFRSEAGMPGAGPADLIRQYGAGYEMPASRENPYWMLTGGWWIQWEQYLAEGGIEDDLDAFVTWSQERQATLLYHAAKMTKERFPEIGGFIVWMGHDCYPCPANTSVIDYLARPKPSGLALSKVWKTK